ASGRRAGAPALGGGVEDRHAGAAAAARRGRSRLRAPARERRRARRGGDAVPDPHGRVLVPRGRPLRDPHGGRCVMASIAFDHVTKVFDETAAVDDLDIEVADGEFLVLVGPSGCGKTTALRMLAGLEEISKGRILTGDRVVNNVAPGARDVAMVFQSYALYPHMTVYDNLAFSLRNRHMPKAEVERRVMQAAEILELDKLVKRKPKQLSGG